MSDVLTQMVVGGIESLPPEAKSDLRPSLSRLGQDSGFLTDLRARIEAGASYEDVRRRAADELAGGRLISTREAFDADFAPLLRIADALDRGEGLERLNRDTPTIEASSSLLHLHDAVLAGFIVNEQPDLVRAADRALKAAALIELLRLQPEGQTDDFFRKFWTHGGVRIEIDLPPARSASWPNGPEGEKPVGTQPGPAGGSAASPGAVPLELDQDRTRIRELHAAARDISTRSRARLAGSTQDLLRSFGPAKKGVKARDTLTLIDQEISRLRDKYGDMQARPWTGTVMIGTLLIEVDDRVFANPGCDPKDLICYCDLLDDLTRKHWASSQVHVLGMGQTFRVRQTFKQYLPGELVHTEPVLGGSTKMSSFEELNETEETTETFTSEEREEEKSARTQSEFELSSEIERESKKERETEIGASMSASYGTVSVSAMAGSTTATATADAVKEARKNAQQIVQNAVSRMRSTSEQRRTLRTLNRTRRNNSFELKNTGASSTGFYFSINKEYEHQMILVGRRLVFRITVQRPLAFLLHCLASSPQTGISLSKPVDPRVYDMPLYGPLTSAGQLHQDNALAWAALYGAEVEPAPQPITVTHAMAVDQKSDKLRWAGLEVIEIPKGYRADEASVSVLMYPGYYMENNTTHAVPVRMDLHLGDALLSFTQPQSTTGGIALSGEEGAVQLTYKAACWEHAINVLVECVASPTAYTAWQVKAFAAIRDAFEKRKAAYENQVLTAEINQGVKVRGRNPLRNRQMIEEELQKFALGAVYPPFYYRGFDSLKFGKACGEGGPARPEVDFIDAHGETPWITFFLQMLELKNMTYKFLPYAFGNRPDWMTLRRLEDADPLFETAMTAGQVVIDMPVAPGMTAAFLHFIKTGQIWLGGQMPLIGDPMFQDIAYMIQQSEDLDDGMPVEEPWTVVAPTSLVYVSDTPPAQL